MIDVNNIATNQLRADLGSVYTANQIAAILQMATTGMGNFRSMIRLEVSNSMIERRDSNCLTKYSVIKRFLNITLPEQRSVVYITAGIGTVFNSVSGLYDLDLPPLWMAAPQVTTAFPGWLDPSQIVILILDIDLAQCSFSEDDIAMALVCPNTGGYNRTWYFAQEVFPNEFANTISNTTVYTSQCGNTTSGGVDSTTIFSGLQFILDNIAAGPNSTLIATKCSVGESGSTLSLGSLVPSTQGAVVSGGQWVLSSAVPLINNHLGSEVYHF